MVRRFLLLGLSLIAMALFSAGIASAARHNGAAVLLLRAQMGGRAPLERALQWLNGIRSCRAHWLRGWAYNGLGREALRDREWETFLSCDPQGVALVEAHLPEDRGWAERALELAPQAAESWFWLARLSEKADPEEAARLYRQGLALNPMDAHRWDRLGFMLGSFDPDAAFAAFVRSCDLGGKGCRWGR